MVELSRCDAGSSGWEPDFVLFNGQEFESHQLTDLCLFFILFRG